MYYVICMFITVTFLWWSSLYVKELNWRNVTRRMVVVVGGKVNISSLVINEVVLTTKCYLSTCLRSMLNEMLQWKKNFPLRFSGKMRFFYVKRKTYRKHNVSSRWYKYISTLHYLVHMERCKKIKLLTLRIANT